MAEQDCPNRGAEGKLALEDLLANKDAYIEQRVAFYKDLYANENDKTLRRMAEDDYESCLRKYEKYDSYSPLDDWSVNEPDVAKNPDNWLDMIELVTAQNSLGRELLWKNILRISPDSFSPEMKCNRVKSCHSSGGRFTCGSIHRRSFHKSFRSR